MTSDYSNALLYARTLQTLVLEKVRTMIQSRQMTLREHVVSTIWWAAIFVIAVVISDSFISGWIAAILTKFCDAAYVDIRSHRP